MAEDGRIAIIHRKSRVYDGFFKLDDVQVTFSRPDGGGYVRANGQLVFERGDSAAAIIHDVEADTIILTEQFRLATYQKGPGWLVEAMAGQIRPHETPEQCIRREMQEETGYLARELRLISQFYASPGGSSEQIFLYYAPVRAADLVQPDASGVASDGEHIRRITVPRSDFIAGCRAGRYRDGKLLVAGLWLAAGGAGETR